MSDLRETIGDAVLAKLDETVALPYTLPNYVKSRVIADVVLDVVTAHMAVNESDIVATNHVFGCERRENALRVALEAFVARKLKAETQ